jgi:hypothetical protein
MLMNQHAKHLAEMAYHLCGRLRNENFGDLEHAIEIALASAEANGCKAACIHRKADLTSSIVDRQQPDPFTNDTFVCSKCGTGFKQNPHIK